MPDGKWYLTYAQWEGNDVPCLDMLERNKSNYQYTSADQTIQRGKYPFAPTRLLTTDDLKDLTLEDLQIMCNEIYARHNMIFKDGGKMDKYFGSQSWYLPRSKNKESLLSDIEKENVKMIKKRNQPNKLILLT